jgi:hypothetical protein
VSADLLPRAQFFTGPAKKQLIEIVEQQIGRNRIGGYPAGAETI